MGLGDGAEVPETELTDPSVVRAAERGLVDPVQVDQTTCAVEEVLLTPTCVMLLPLTMPGDERPWFAVPLLTIPSCPRVAVLLVAPFWVVVETVDEADLHGRHGVLAEAAVVMRRRRRRRSEHDGWT